LDGALRAANRSQLKVDFALLVGTISSYEDKLPHARCAPQEGMGWMFGIFSIPPN